MEELTKKKTYNISQQALTFFLLGLFFFTLAQAQEKKKIVIRQADKQTYQKQGVNDVFWLVGHVVYEHDGAVMSCDSSIYMRSANTFSAFGNVHINQADTIQLHGDMMEYDGDTRLLILRGNVRLFDGKMNLTCNEIVYDRNLGYAFYSDGGILNQSANKLVSRVGSYNTNSKRFTFRDSVRLTNPNYHIVTDTLQYGSENEIAYFLGPTSIISDSTTIYCERGDFDTKRDVANLTKCGEIVKKAQTIRGDSIHYKAKTGIGRIYGNAYIQDTLNKYVITGGYAEYVEKPEFALVTKRPLYSLQMEKDSLFLTGDTLRVTTDSLKKRRVRVYNHARFYKSDFQGKCDSLIYTEQDSAFYLYQSPVVWNQNNQLTADFIFMTTRKGNLDSLHMIGNAFMIAREDSLKYNQIKGRDMYGLFNENELRSIYVSGNGQTLYYAYDDEEKQIGINRADCSNLRILIAESKVKRVAFLTKPNATLYPPGRIPQGELFLRGFNPRYAETFKNKEDLLQK